MKMNVEDTDIEGVKPLTPRRFEENRGFFSEGYNSRADAGAGLDPAQAKLSTLMFAVSSCKHEYSFAPDRAFQIDRR
jgi:dTDP-4-dehydrorhamnose 3,5-epimerase-like enzyme